MMGGVFSLVVFVIYWSKKSHNDAWARAAEQLKLDFKAGGFGKHSQLTGKYRGYFVSVDIEVHSHGKSSTTYTRYKVWPGTPIPDGLVVTKEGLLNKIGKFLGGQDIQVGDPVVDNSLLIKGRNEREVFEFFHKTGAGKLLLQLMTLGRMARFTASEGFVVLVLGVQKNPTMMGAKLDEIVALAKRMDGTHTPLLQAPQAELDPLPTQAPPRPEPVPVRAPERLPFETKPAPPPQRLPFEDPPPKPATKPVVAAEPAPAPKPAAPAPAPKPSKPADPRHAQLQRLADRALGYRDRQEILRSLSESDMDLRVAVRSTEDSRAIGLPSHYLRGRTLIGMVGQVEVSVRFPDSENARIDAMAPGDVVAVQATLHDFDNFYRRAVFTG